MGLDNRLRYFGYCETPSVLRDLDSWIRRRLRCVQWKQWKGYQRRKADHRLES
ncbi:MAG: group II intron maturase-specific domain-containing protein [Gammaproteobacteria bacterium]